MTYVPPHFRSTTLWIGAGSAVAALVAVGAFGLREQRIAAVAEHPPGAVAGAVSALAERQAVRVEPSELLGYAGLSVHDQSALLVALERRPSLRPETVEFLLALVGRRSATPLHRNLACNALTVPGRTPTGLLDTLLRQIQDEQEDPLWRDYAVQHAATLAGQGERSAEVVRALSREIGAATPRAGTAFLQLQRLEEQYHQPLAPAVVDGFAAACCARPTADINATISLVGVLAQRDDRRHLPQIRALLTVEVGGIRRAALGALGRLGDAGDLPAVSACANDPDETVALAARIAANRLRSGDRTSMASLSPDPLPGAFP